MKDVAIWNNQNIYRLIRNTGSWEAGVSKVIQEFDCLLIHSQECRLERWEKCFRKRFSWSTFTVDH